MHKYEIILYWSREDQCYIAEVPELSGCIAHGNTQQEALVQANEAVQLWLETAQHFVGLPSQITLDGTLASVGCINGVPCTKLSKVYDALLIHPIALFHSFQDFNLNQREWYMYC